MPRHATKTSFKPGHKQSPEVRKKINQAIRERVARGWRLRPIGYKVSPEEIEKRAKTRRLRCLGNTTLAYRGKNVYRQVRTLEGLRYEHRVVMEEMLGRPLKPSEHVHHKNGDGLDNRRENLELLGHSDHMRLHGALNKPKWAKLHDACLRCRTIQRRHVGRGFCTACYQMPETKIYLKSLEE